MTKFTVSPTVNTYTTQEMLCLSYCLVHTLYLQFNLDINFNNMLQVSQLPQCTTNTWKKKQQTCMIC